MEGESPSLTAASTPAAKDGPPPLSLDKKKTDAPKAAPASGAKKPQPPPLTWGSVRAGYAPATDVLVRNGDTHRLKQGH